MLTFVLLMKSYDTLSEAIRDLQQRGYTENFNLEKDCLNCEQHGIYLCPEDFVVEEVYRFEGETDPGDENVVYAISSKDKGLRGVLVNAFGMYAEEVSAELAKKLHYDPKE